MAFPGFPNVPPYPEPPHPSSGVAPQGEQLEQLTAPGEIMSAVGWSWRVPGLIPLSRLELSLGVGTGSEGTQPRAAFSAELEVADVR